MRRPCGAAAVRTCGRGKVHDGLAKSLARDSTGGEARSPNGCSALDQSNALTQLCRLNGAALACRTAADADQVVIKGVAHRGLLAERFIYRDAPDVKHHQMHFLDMRGVCARNCDEMISFTADESD